MTWRSSGTKEQGKTALPAVHSVGMRRVRRFWDVAVSGTGGQSLPMKLTYLFENNSSHGSEEVLQYGARPQPCRSL